MLSFAERQTRPFCDRWWQGVSVGECTARVGPRRAAIRQAAATGSLVSALSRTGAGHRPRTAPARHGPACAPTWIAASMVATSIFAISIIALRAVGDGSVGVGEGVRDGDRCDRPGG